MFKQVEKEGFDFSEGSFTEGLATIEAKIAECERQISENKKIVDLVLIEVKQAFQRNLAKLQSIQKPVPEVQKPATTFVTRDVFVATPGYVPTGNDYVCPVKPTFENPITAIYEVKD